jgi:outer membrane autotransporter protein
MIITARDLRRTISAVALLAACAPIGANAADFTVGDGQTAGEQSLAGGQAGTVEVGGTVSDDGPAVRFTGGAGVATLTNSGTVTGTDGRGIDSGSGDAAGGAVVIDNKAGAVIQGTDDAIRIRLGGDFAGVTLTNAGTIVSTGGQALDFNSLSSGTAAISIVNEATGLIEATDADAVRPGNGATVTNRGTIRSLTAGGNNPDGIDFQDFGGTVVNSGTITAVRHGVTGDGFVILNNEAGGQVIGRNGAGMNIDGDGQTTNFGTITGGCAGDLADCDGDGVDIDGIATIDNHGTIAGTAAQGLGSDDLPNTADGIAAGGGTIINRAGATISSTGRAILVDDSSQGPALAAVGIDNAGTITGTDIAIKIVGTQDDTVTNTGLIAATAPGGIAIDLGGGDDILNLGTGSVITGLVDGGDGSDRVVLDGEGSFGGGSNFESLTLAQGNWVLSGSQSYAAGVTIEAGATLAGNATITGNVTNAGTVAPGSSPGTISIVGDYTQDPAGTLISEITSTGSDLLAVTGTATLAGTQDIAVEYGTYLDGLSVDLVTAGAGITGDFTTVTINENAFFTVTRTVAAGAETVSFDRLSFAEVAPGDANAAAVGAAFEAGIAAGAGGAAFTGLVQNLIDGSSVAGAAAVFGDLAGAGDADLQALAADAARGLAGRVFDRFGTAGTCAADSPNCFWGQGFGAVGSADADRFSPGYDLTTAGVVFGYDRQIGSSLRVGVSGGFADTRPDFDNGDEGKIATFSAALYGHYQQGAFDATAVISAAHNDLRTDRGVAGSTASGETDGYAYGASAEAGWRFALGASSWARPYLGLGYDSASFDAYDETGSLGASHVDPDDLDSLRGRAGVDLATSFKLGEGAARPYLGLGVEHDFLDPQPELTRELAILPGVPVTVRGGDRERTAGIVEAGISLDVQPGIALFAGYDGRLAGDRQNHAGNAGLRINW